VSDTVEATLPLKRWAGEKAVYHLVTFSGAEAEALVHHALMQRLEYGRARGFGSIKVTARIGATEWKTSVFPQNKQPPSNSEAVGQKERQWILLVSKKVMRAEDLAPGDAVTVTVTPI
jgi:hypothetical protein